MATADTTDPRGSKRTGSLARVVGTTAMIAISVANAMAAVTRKIEPQ